MAVVNPPYTLDEALDEALPWLARKLAVDARGA
jgi:23S rRNA A2030 N6-methylase RlmJ